MVWRLGWLALAACGSTAVQDAVRVPTLDPAKAACERAARTLCPKARGTTDTAGADECQWREKATLEVEVCRGQTVHVPMYSDGRVMAVVTWSPPGAVRVTVDGTAMVNARFGDAEIIGQDGGVVVGIGTDRGRRRG